MASGAGIALARSRERDFFAFSGWTLLAALSLHDNTNDVAIYEILFILISTSIVICFLVNERIELIEPQALSNVNDLIKNSQQ